MRGRYDLNNIEANNYINILYDEINFAVIPKSYLSIYQEDEKNVSLSKKN